MEEMKLLSYLHGWLSDVEVCQVEEWCDAAPENRRVLEQLYYTTFVGDRFASMSSVDVDSSFSRFRELTLRKEQTSKRSSFSRWRRYALPLAAFLTGIIFAIGFSFFTLNNPSNFIVATTAGQRAQFVLPDGSKVWLNSSTQLSYKTSLWSRERRVDLIGEAYFEVSHQKDVPFVVSSKEVNVEVLGTKFDVRARSDEDRVVTTLLKGSVRVDLLGKNNESYLLAPEQILEVNTQSGQAVLTTSSSAKDVLLWMGGRLQFEQTSFETITHCLEKHFDVRFRFADDKLKNELFTCEFFTDNNITDIMDVLSLTKRFDYQIEGKQITLSIKK